MARLDRAIRSGTAGLEEAQSLDGGRFSSHTTRPGPESPVRPGHDGETGPGQHGGAAAGHDVHAAAGHAATERPDAQHPPPVEVLEPALWRQLTEADGTAAKAQYWAPLAVRLIPGARQAAVVMAGPNGFTPAAMWPSGEPPADLLMAAVEATLDQRTGSVRLGRVRGPGREAAVALPLMRGSEVIGAAGVTLKGASEDRLRVAMRHLQWGSGWLRGEARSATMDQGPVLDVLGPVVEEAGFRAAAQRAVTSLAIRFGCDRVSVGFRRGAGVRVAAISHAAIVEERSDDTRRLAAAMEEAMDQRAMLRFPPTEEEAREPLARLAQEHLAGPGGGTVLTIPLVRGDDVTGALVLERTAARPITAEDITRLDVLSAMLGPVLWEKWREDRWLIGKAREAAANQMRLLLGPDHAGRKLALLAAAVVALLAATWHGEYRVIAQAHLEGTVRRSVVAGLDGFLADAPVRAGDRVRAGDVLARLDDRDLTLERLRWTTERQQRRQELERAIGERRRADVNIIQAQLDQAEAQLALAEVQLARTKFTAPFDALVVAGDHSQGIGGAVRRGDVLFELAPLDDWRVSLDVEEAQVADIHPGQRGELAAAAMPWHPLGFTVTRVTPVARVEDGRSVFRVEAALDETSPRLRPGMRGVGHIDAGSRLWAWIWTRRLLEQTRLWFWQAVL